VLAGLTVVALATAEILVAPGTELTALQCGLVLAGFGAIDRWTRRNRAALDHLDWCECASARVTVRVIPSRRREGARVAIADTPVPVETQSSVEVELEEVVR
jgi:hypothetical protein